MKLRAPLLVERGITLVELLAVVAILAVLSGLVSAGINSASRSARVGASTSNLRQIALAALVYSADHGNRLLPHAIFDPELGQNREWCYGYFQFGIENALAQGILGPYLEDAQRVLRCPVWEADESVQKMIQAGGKPGLLGYGYNGLNLSQMQPPESSPGGQMGHYVGYPLAAVEDHHKTIMFTTSAKGFGSFAAPEEMVWGPDHVIKSPCVRLVTKDRALAAFVDGSVQLVPAIPTTSPTKCGVVRGTIDLNDDGTADVEPWKK